MQRGEEHESKGNMQDSVTHPHTVLLKESGPPRRVDRPSSCVFIIAVSSADARQQWKDQHPGEQKVERKPNK